ncbi:MAG: hypothetical protein U0T68_04695 [Ferruginibacter sp.]
MIKEGKDCFGSIAMKKFILACLLFTAVYISPTRAQEVLPALTVKDFNGKIVVSWKNEYKTPVTNISIQRSFDSSRNYSTIGSVLNPQNLENGYADDKPPYPKMYYRLFISFDGGSYTFSNVVRPVKVITAKDQSAAPRWPWQVPPAPAPDTSVTAQPKKLPPALEPITSDEPMGKLNRDSSVQFTPLDVPNNRTPSRRDSIIKRPQEVITYPSQRVYSNRENNVIIHLPDAVYKRYSIKFYDESNNFLFELTKIKEEFLVLEKVNFMHSGWFFFEILENNRLVEKNRLYIGKDSKPENGKRQGNN